MAVTKVAIAEKSLQGIEIKVSSVKWREKRLRSICESKYYHLTGVVKYITI